MKLKVCKLIKLDLRKRNFISVVVELVIQWTCFSILAGIGDLISTNVQIGVALFIAISILTVIQRKAYSCRESVDLLNLSLLVFCNQDASFHFAEPTFSAGESMGKYIRSLGYLYLFGRLGQNPA